ncbi:BTAD domain-containing putative transcriptional regulator [Lentzea sp. JNUCC 0626]|uniref:BTAD domain-containing putative transcriptional regulator n=1 Tax=Lentzea sp. JNUCC 0626 TaxID=3367513 RepID=UPI003747B085
MLAVAVLFALVAGLPWALWHFVGWPLPDHVPTLGEVEALLLSPMTGTFLLNVLACATWLAWARFTFDVLRCAYGILQDGVQAIQCSQVSSREPAHALATVLISAVLLSIAGPRLAHAEPGSSTSSSVSQQVEPRPAPTVVVRPPDPETGLHDSLALISERAFGTQDRWPEIFDLNRGKPQPNGKPFSDPHLIFPGETLRLAADPTPAPKPEQPSAPAQELAPPPSPTTETPAPDDHAPAVSWGTELYIGVGLAAAVTSALATAHHRHRQRYRPGSGKRDDLSNPTAPVIYRLRLASRNAQESNAEPEANAAASPIKRTTARPGSRNGHELALDLAATCGLGLVGPGASSTARALLVTALSTNHPATSAGTRVLVPTGDLQLMFGQELEGTVLPHGLETYTDLDEAVRALKADSDAQVLLAQAPQRHHEHLARALGQRCAVILLGQWQTGVTAYVRADGLVGATNPGRGETLRESRLFHIGADDALDVLTLLRRAEPDRAPSAARTIHLAADPLEIMGENAATPPGRSHRTAPEHIGNIVSQQAVNASVRLQLLGRVRVFWLRSSHDDEVEVTGAFQPRQLELLTFLGLHPDGATRESLVAALWEHSPSERVTSALNTALSRLRNTLSNVTNSTNAIITANGTFALNPDEATVDYWTFHSANTRRRLASTARQRIDADRGIVEAYAGPLADGMSTNWLETAREAIRRDALDAVSDLARALVADNPEQTLDLLETARAFDPHNELLYRDIMRLQGKIGRLEAIPRTLTLLTTRLAEIGDQPSPQSLELATRLQQRNDETEQIQNQPAQSK